MLTERGADGRGRVGLPGLDLQPIFPVTFFFLGAMAVGVPFLRAYAQITRSWRPGWKVSSTGVSRPKMLTSTLSLCCSALTSLMEAGSVANGPSMTVTDSPTSKSTRISGRSRVASPPPAAAVLAAALPAFLARALRQQELHHIIERQRRRPRGRTDEPGDARRVADRGPRVVGQIHPHQDVAQQDLAVDLFALTVLDLGDLFGGHFHLEDVVADIEVLHAGLEVGLHLVLVAGVDG